MSALQWCDGLGCRVVAFDAADPACPGCGVAGHPIPTRDALPVWVQTILARLREPAPFGAGERG